jgi:twitching motility protein PilT
MSAKRSQEIIGSAVAAGASDIHIGVGSPVMLRIDGVLHPQEGGDVTPEEAEGIVREILGEQRMERLRKDREIDVSFDLGDGVRVRVNCHYERGNVSVAARIIPSHIPTLEQIEFMEVGERILKLRSGMVLFTGPTGSGKSTSLASLIAHMNAEAPRSIVTLEDPIEFVFPKGKGIVRQREYGMDFLSFAEALKRVLRQDPEVIMVGEMRDPETIAAALTLAETGHLILATLHTPNALLSVDRIIDAFPAHQQSQVRSQLSLSLRMVVAQHLVPSLEGGRIALREVMVNTVAVGNVIRTNRTPELASVMQMGDEAGMITFEKAAKKLYKEKRISKETLESALTTLK